MGRSGRGGKSRPTGIRSPDRPAHSHSLCRLSYPAHIPEDYEIELLWINISGIEVLIETRLEQTKSVRSDTGCASG